MKNVQFLHSSFFILEAVNDVALEMVVRRFAI
jgi:hypothetical protein